MERKAAEDQANSDTVPAAGHDSATAARSASAGTAAAADTGISFSLCSCFLPARLAMLSRHIQILGRVFVHGVQTRKVQIPERRL